MSRARRLLVGAALLSALGAAGTFAVGYRLTRRKAPRAPEPPRPARGLTPEALELVAQDGLRFGAWLYAVPGGASCAAVLVHGNGSRRTSLATLTTEVLAAGCHAMPITVRAHGDAEGEINDFGYSAKKDVIRAVEELSRRLPEARLSVIGVSLGSAAALFAGEELGARVQAYLLESPYASLEIATKNRIRLFFPEWLVPPAYLGLTIWSDTLLPVPVAEIAPAAAAERLPASARVVVLAGTADTRATLAEARAVVEAVPGPVQLILFEGADHDELYDLDRDRYRAALRSVVTSTSAR